MSDLNARPRLTWGSALTVAGLAVLVIAVLRGQLDGREPAGWLATGAAVLAVAAVFLLGRGFQQYLWGVAAGVLLIIHPWFAVHATRANDSVLVAEALVLAVLAATQTAGRLTFLPRFAWYSWAGMGAALCLGVWLAWTSAPPMAVLAIALAAGGLLLAAILGIRVGRQAGAATPSRWNLAAAGLVAVAAVGVGLFASYGQTPDGSAGGVSRLLHGIPPVRANLTGVFSRDAVTRWGWPTAWVMLPLTAWALWRTVRRGWMDWARGRAPTPWLLTLAAVLIVLHAVLWPVDDALFPAWPLTAVTVLLVVFCVADVLAQIGNRLVLHPPEEKATERVAR
jgi:hypothetical protein